MKDEDKNEFEFVIQLDRRDILIEAYELRDFLQALLASGEPLTAEARKHHAGRFAAVKRRLALVDGAYRQRHSRVVEFFARDILSEVKNVGE